MKIIVIGGNPAGLSAASAVRRVHPDWIIDVYEKGPYISYGSCGLPYYISGIIEDRDKLITITKEQFLEKRNIPVHIYQEVVSVNFEAKIVKVKDINTNEIFESDYDYMVIATGGKPKTRPEIALKHNHVFHVHTIEDADKVKNFLNGSGLKSGILLGAGYINQEMVEAFKAQGIDDLTLVGPRLIFRTKSQEYIKKELEKNGIKIVLGKYAKSLEAVSDKRLRVSFEDGVSLEADFVQISIGVVPNTDLFNGTKLKMTNGAIIVDEYMRTNIENVFAAGDCTTVYHQILKRNTYIPLAPAANKQGRIAGNVIAGNEVDPFPGVIGTSVWKVFDLYCGKTGITAQEAKELGYDPGSVLIESNEIAHYYPNRGNQFKLKMTTYLLFDVKTHLLLGAEITAPSPLGGKKIDVLATALAAKMKIEDIQKLDLSYAPPFAPVWDSILIAANVARKKCL